jgi:hypothetical protein
MCSKRISWVFDQYFGPVDRISSCSCPFSSGARKFLIGSFAVLASLGLGASSTASSSSRVPPLLSTKKEWVRRNSKQSQKNKEDLKKSADAARAPYTRPQGNTWRTCLEPMPDIAVATGAANMLTKPAIPTTT